MPKFRYMLVESGKPAVHSPEDDYGTTEAARAAGNAVADENQTVILVEDRSDEVPKFEPKKMEAATWTI